MSDGSEELVLELVPAGNERSEQLQVRVAIRTQLRCCVLERAPYEYGRAVIERVSDRSGRLDQVKLELQRAEERGGEERRVDRGADVVAKPGERQLRGARPTADRLLRFDDADRTPCLGERDRGGKAVRPGPDYDRV